jgi:hypothetical protein
VDTVWLSQVLGYLVYTTGGMEGIALLYGLVEVAKAVLYLAAFRRLTGSLLLAVLGVALVQAGQWTYFGVFNPQAIAELCWAYLLLASAQWLVASDEGRSRAASHWALATLPLVFALWANLHGSFVLGLVVLGTLLAGRCVEQAWAARDLSAPLRDSAVRWLALILALSAAATCLNPYGTRLISEIVSYRSRHPAMQQAAEWHPLQPLATYPSQAFTVSVVLVLVTARFSPRRFQVADLVLLLLFGLAAWFWAPPLRWWMTICPFVLLPHWAAFRDKVTRWQGDKMTDRHSSTHLVTLSPCHLVTLSGVAIALALVLASATGRWLLRQGPRPVEEQVAPTTPVQLADRLEVWLAEHPAPVPRRVLASPALSDYLLWRLPPEAQLYAYSHYEVFDIKHLEPLFEILQQTPGLGSGQGLLDRYEIDVLALSTEDRFHALFNSLLEQQRPESPWQVIYTRSEPGSRPTELLAVRSR